MLVALLVSVVFIGVVGNQIDKITTYPLNLLNYKAKKRSKCAFQVGAQPQKQQ